MPQLLSRLFPGVGPGGVPDRDAARAVPLVRGLPALMDASSRPQALVDAAGCVLRVNLAFARVLGSSRPAAFAGQDLGSLLGGVLLAEPGPGLSPADQVLAHLARRDAPDLWTCVTLLPGRPAVLLVEVLGQAGEVVARHRSTQTAHLEGGVSPRLPRLSSTMRCVAAGGEGAVGGDFLDVLPLTSSRVALLLGDVAGHGTEVAALTTEVAATLRAYAGMGLGPCEVVRCTDEALAAQAEPPFVTCCYGELDLDDGTLRLVRAGHLPPLLLRADGSAELLRFAPDLPLGVERITALDEHRLRLAPGDAVLLCSDGMVESRRTPVDEGLADLVAVAGATTARRLDRLADAVLACVRPVDSRDDACLLVVRYDGPTSDLGQT